jgi:hypothetical protein
MEVGVKKFFEVTSLDIKMFTVFVHQYRDTRSEFLNSLTESFAADVDVEFSDIIVLGLMECAG